MKTVINIMLFLIILFLFSCEKLDTIVKCSECIPAEPESTDLIIMLEYGSNIPAVVRIYEGELEDNILRTSFNTLASESTFPVNLNKKYTVTATYEFKGITYIAVDSAIPRVKYVSGQCDDPCYYVYNRTVDLRLKYTVH